MKLLHLINNLISTDTTEPVIRKVEEVEVTYEDGTTEMLPRKLEVPGKDTCAVCMGDAYHFYLDCQGLRWEETQCDLPIKIMTTKNAAKAGMHLCCYCDSRSYEESRYLKDNDFDDLNEDIDSDD